MDTNVSRRLAMGLVVMALAAFPTGASAHLNYSKNSVSGEDKTSPASQVRHLDYSRNSVSGEDNPASPQPPSVAVPARVAKSGAGFSWSAAGAGAGATLLTLFLAGTWLMRRRRAGTVAPRSPLIG